MTPAIALNEVTKTFGKTTAVEQLNLVVPRGSLYGFIGPNGAGKTTSIRMIMSILFPDSGSLSVLGHASALDAKDRIGYLPEERGLYRKMRVGAFLTYIGRLKGVADAELAPRVTRFLESVGLGGTARKRCEELSKGMQQKVQIIVVLKEGTDPATAISRLALAVTPARIELARPRLEDVFVRIVSGGHAAGEDEAALRAKLRDGAERAVAVWGR